MCGIVGIFETQEEERELRATAIRLARRLRHRGPDWSGVWAGEGAVLAHERLSIVDVEHGAQPLVAPAGAPGLPVNGEIYTHAERRAGLREPYAFRTASDCEVILAL